MKKLNKAVTILSKIGEICIWIGTALMAALFLTGVIAPDKLHFLVDSCTDITIRGFSIAVIDKPQETVVKSIIMIALAGMLIFPLDAMIFRNIHRIFKSSENKTPFQTDNVRMVREIGIFSIAGPMVELIVSSIAQLFVGALAETSVNMDGVFFGLVVLCLSQFFAYGMSLQEEVDGLL